MTLPVSCLRRWTAIPRQAKILYPLRAIEAEPFSGPRRAAARQGNTEPTSQGRTSSRDIGRAIGWLGAWNKRRRDSFVTSFALYAFTSSRQPASDQP